LGCFRKHKAKDPKGKEEEEGEEEEEDVRVILFRGK
jgi:hypothetical protein